MFEVDSATRLGPDGTIQHTVIRGFTPQGDAAESFDVAAGVATWKCPVDAGSRPYAGPALYLAFGGPVEQTADFVEALVGEPGRSMALLPGG